MANEPIKKQGANIVRKEEKSPAAITPQSNTAAQLMQRELSEIQSAMQLAKMFPRDIEVCKAAVTATFSDPIFADEAIYAKPQGWKTDASGERIKENGKDVRNFVEGLSVDAALELKNICGNILLGGTIIDENEDRRTIEIYAWDVQTNNRVSQQIAVPKSIERKFVNKGDIKIGERSNSKGEVLHIIRPSEDEFRLSESRSVSFAQRNCILKVMPSALKLAAERTANEALVKGAADGMAEAKKPSAVPKKDPRQGIVEAFKKKLKVSKEQIESYMQAKIDDWTPEMVADLTKIGKQLNDSADPIKAATEVFGASEAKPEPAKAKASNAANRGHDDNGLDQVKENLFDEEPAGEPEGSAAWE